MTPPPPCALSALPQRRGGVERGAPGSAPTQLTNATNKQFQDMLRALSDRTKESIVCLPSPVWFIIGMDALIIQCVRVLVFSE